MGTKEQIICILVSLIATICTAQHKPWPPQYSLHNMPKTSFTCRDKILGGYYADSETQCQMFHVCVKVAGVGVQDFRFLCPNGTAFDQEAQTCADWGDVDCEQATLYYGSDNFDLYRLGSGFESKRAPLADEDEAPFHLQRAESADIRRSKQTVVNQSTSPDRISLYNKGTPKPSAFVQQNPTAFQPRSDEYRKQTTLAKPVTDFVNSYKPNPATNKPIAKISNVNSEQDDKDNEEIFKGSHSSNFFNNRNNGKEDDLEDIKPRQSNPTKQFRGRQRSRNNYDNSNAIQAVSKIRSTTQSTIAKVNTARPVPSTTTQLNANVVYNTARPAPQRSNDTVSILLQNNNPTIAPVSTTTQFSNFYNPYLVASSNNNNNNQNSASIQPQQNDQKYSTQIQNLNFEKPTQSSRIPDFQPTIIPSSTPAILNRPQQKPLQDPFKVTYNLPHHQQQQTPDYSSIASSSTVFPETSPVLTKINQFTQSTQQQHFYKSTEEHRFDSNRPTTSQNPLQTTFSNENFKRQNISNDQQQTNVNHQRQDFNNNNQQFNKQKFNNQEQNYFNNQQQQKNLNNQQQNINNQQQNLNNQQQSFNTQQKNLNSPQPNFNDQSQNFNNQPQSLKKQNDFGNQQNVFNHQQQGFHNPNSNDKQNILNKQPQIINNNHKTIQQQNQKIGQQQILKIQPQINNQPQNFNSQPINNNAPKTNLNNSPQSNFNNNQNNLRTNPHENQSQKTIIRLNPNYNFQTTTAPLEGFNVPAANTTRSRGQPLRISEPIFNSRNQKIEVRENHRTLTTSAVGFEPNPTTYNPRQNQNFRSSPKEFSIQQQSTLAPSTQQQSQNRYQTINRSTDTYTPSTVKKFSTLVPRDQYNPTTFKPSTAQRIVPEPFNVNNNNFNNNNQHQVSQPNSFNNNPIVLTSSTSSTTTTTTTLAPLSDDDEDDGQYRPELYEKDFFKNKLKQKQQTRGGGQFNNNFSNFNFKTNQNYQTSSALPSRSGEDEFFDTAHSQNIAYSGNELRLANALKSTPKPFSKQTSPHVYPSTIKSTAKTTTRKPTLLSKVNDKDASYDYAYYDINQDSSPGEYSEYEIKDFGKTKKQKS